MNKILLLIALMGLLLAGGPAFAQQAGPSAAPTSSIDVHNLPPLASGKPFDPQKATMAYLAQVERCSARHGPIPISKAAMCCCSSMRSIPSAVSGLLLWFRISARMRTFAQARTRLRFWQVPIYVAQYIVLTAVLSLPLTIYEGFFREQSYGLMNQTFLSWFGDQTILLGLTLVAGVVLLTLIYSAIRRTKRNWWLWGTAIVTAFNTILLIIAPVFIAPLFNHYSPLPQSPLRSDILSMARANGIPADNVYLSDASRQSDRISANVSGFLGTTRITLNDNLLRHGTHDEVLAVLGHEMGHYVLDHGFAPPSAQCARDRRWLCFRQLGVRCFDGFLRRQLGRADH